MALIKATQMLSDSALLCASPSESELAIQTDKFLSYMRSLYVLPYYSELQTAVCVYISVLFNVGIYLQVSI